MQLVPDVKDHLESPRPGRPEDALQHVQLPLGTRRDRPALGRLVMRLVRRHENAKAVQGALRVVPRAPRRGRRDRPAGEELALRLVRYQ